MTDHNDVVVITGSSRGVGLGLARELLARGCRVVISARGAAALEAAAAELGAVAGGADRVLAVPADVNDPAAVERLWQAAVERFGGVQVWINNAALSHALAPAWEIPVATVQHVLMTNLTGTMNGSRVAMRGMLAAGGGKIFNLEGFGSTGMKRPGMSVYGASKRAIRYFTESLAREAKGTPVIVGSISPGIIVTELLLKTYDGRPEDWQRASKFLKIAADRVEDVAPWLAERVLRMHKNGTRIAWLTPRRLLGRFLAAPMSRRDPFAGAALPRGAAH